jgi:hypothetical protein
MPTGGPGAMMMDGIGLGAGNVPPQVTGMDMMMGMGVTEQLQMYLDSTIMWAKQHPLEAAAITIGSVLILFMFRK